MSPKKIREAMHLQGGHEIRITFGPERQEWRIAFRPAPWAPPGTPPPKPIMMAHGEDWANIDPAYPVTVEVADPLERGGNNLVAAIRRLRGLMAGHGLRETAYAEGPHSRSITFLDPAAAEALGTAGAPPRRKKGVPPSEESLAETERRLGIGLPGDYRAFLLLPTRRSSSAEGRTFLILAPDPADLEDFEFAIERLRGGVDLPDWLVPVAFEDEDVVLMAISGPRSGHVFLCPDIEGEFDEGDLEPIAGSFTEYLAADRLG